MGDGGAKGESDAARVTSVASTAEALEELGYACAFRSDGLIEILRIAKVGRSRTRQGCGDDGEDGARVGEGEG